MASALLGETKGVHPGLTKINLLIRGVVIVR